MLWTLFLLIPFLGRLKLFYENESARRLTGWLTEATMVCLWADRIYMAGILAAAAYIFGKRLQLWTAVARMRKMMLDGAKIRVTDMNVTPFAVGLLKPKIVLPKGMLDHYSREELKVIIQHEQTHIRLGHLWCGFAWDILRCLLWINPFLTIYQKYLRADMEEICDRVCIQNCGKNSREYGLILLKSIKILRFEQKDMPSAATYIREKDFADMKRWMEQIADFRPYRKRRCIGMTITLFMAIGMTLFIIHTCSYARYRESDNIVIYQYSNESAIVSNNTEKLKKMISYDDSYVYVDREAFEDFLCQNQAQGEIYIVFGGYDKLPGLGSVSETCFYESGSKDALARIPYESISHNWDFILFKLL